MQKVEVLKSSKPQKAGKVFYRILVTHESERSNSDIDFLNTKEKRGGHIPKFLKNDSLFEW